MKLVSLCFLAVLAGTACSNETEGESVGALEIYTSWVAPGESSALDALLSRFNAQHPKTNVVVTRASNQSVVPVQLETRLAGGSIPDTFQTVGGGDLLRWVLYNGVDDADNRLEALNTPAQASGLFTALPSIVRNALSHENRIYAIPLDVARVNVLFYNAQVLSRNQLLPPTTLIEFFAAAEVLKAKGIVPLALGTKDGTVVSQILFDGLLLAQGVPFRDTYLSGEGMASDPLLTEAIGELGKLLDYTNPDRDNLDWTQAARLVVDGSAAMTITGDWAKAFFATAGLDPDGGLGQVVFPDTQGKFAFLVDSFALPIGAPNRTAALDFLTFIGTKEAADVFSPLKGTMAARLDVDRSGYDVIAQQTAEDFRSTTLTLGHRAKIRSMAFLTELDATLRQFAIDRRATPVLNMLNNRYGQLSTSGGS